MRPNYEQHANLSTNNQNGFFCPPVHKDGFYKDPAVWFRWQGGRIVEVQQNTLSPSPLVRHSVATVFSQKPSTDHLMTVNINALERDVVAYAPWRVLSFEHIPKSNTNSTYSYVKYLGGEEHLAARGSNDWMGQLLPFDYNYQQTNIEGYPSPSETSSAGLVGSLPILIALAAFSAPRANLVQALTGSMLPRTWRRHAFPTGRKLSFLHARTVLIATGTPQRGMVVTIYYDPSNPTNSTQAILNGLQSGHYGAFYT